MTARAPIAACLAALFVGPAHADPVAVSEPVPTELVIEDAESMGLLGADDWREGYEEGDAEQPTAWPDKVVVDAKAGSVLLLWRARGDVGSRAIQLPFDQITRFEQQRATPSHPDELVIVADDGSRFLVARGAAVSSATIMVAPVTGRSVRQLAADAPWPAADPAGAEGDPQMVLGSITSDHLAMVAATQEASEAGLAVATDAGTRGTVGAAVAGKPQGKLEKSVIDGVIKARMNLLRTCYQRQLQRNPNLSGSVVLRFVIDTDGVVTAAVVKASDLDNHLVEACLIDEMRATRFPAPTGNGVVVVSYPFNFQPG